MWSTLEGSFFIFFLFQRFCKLTRFMTTKISALVEFMLWSSGLFFFNNQINISLSYFDHEAMKRFVSLWLCLANGLRSDPRFWDFEPFIYDLWNNKISNQIIGHGSFKIVSTIELNRCSPLIVKLTKSVEHCRKSGLRYNFVLLLDLPGSARLSEFAPSDVSLERSKVLEVVRVLKLVPERYDCQSLLEFSSLPLIDPPQGSLLRMCSMVNLRTLLFVVGDGGQCSIGTSGAACFATSSRGFL